MPEPARRQPMTANYQSARRARPTRARPNPGAACKTSQSPSGREPAGGLTIGEARHLIRAHSRPESTCPQPPTPRRRPIHLAASRRAGQWSTAQRCRFPTHRSTPRQLTGSARWGLLSEVADHVVDEQPHGYVDTVAAGAIRDEFDGVSDQVVAGNEQGARNLCALSSKRDELAGQVRCSLKSLGPYRAPARRRAWL